MKPNDLRAQVALCCILTLSFFGCSGSSGSGEAISGATSFSLASQTAVIENSANTDIIVNVVRQGIQGNALVRVDLVEGTASPGIDFILLGGPTQFVMIPEGASSQQFVFGSLVDDTIAEGTETIELRLSNVTAGLSLGPESRLTLEIQDDDAPAQGAIQFEQASGVVDETSGIFGIPLTRTAGVTGAITAEVFVLTGFAVPGVDFTITNPVLTWADQDDANKILDLSIINDAQQEGSEIVVFEIQTTTGGAVIGTRDRYYLEIIDDDVGGEVRFLSAAINVAEGEDATVTLVRTGGSGGVVTVDVRDTGLGSANAPADFLYPANYVPAVGETVTWADGEIGPKSVNFSVLEDSTVEFPETIELELLNPTGDVVVSNTGATFQVEINDVIAASFGDFSFVLSQQQINENGGVVNVGVMRSNGSALGVDVDFVVIGETAQAGVDFSYTGSGTLSWAGGEAGVKTIPINILDDMIFEGDETFRVSLVAVSVGGTISSDDVVVRIKDNEVEPWPLVSIPTTATIRDLKFFGSDFGWAVGDGGEIWERSALSFNNGLWTQRASGTTADLFGVIGEPSLGAIAVGSGGTILVAEAANNHLWIPQVSNTAENLNDIDFGKDPNLSTNIVRYFAVGDNGTILRSTNSINWNVLNSGSTENLNAVRFVNLSRGWAVGTNGTILRTVDGGLNWIPQNSGTTEDLHAIFFFIGNQEGFAVGNNGTILSTLDGGVNWIQQSSGTTENLHTVEGVILSEALNQKSLQVAGANGTILGSPSLGAVWFQSALMATTDFYCSSYGTVSRGYVGGDNGEVRVSFE